MPVSVPQLKFIRALWGAEAQFSPDIDRLFAEFHRLGYAGVEATLSDIHRICEKDRDAFRRALKENQLEFIGLAQTNYPTASGDPWQDLSIDEHIANLEKHLQEFSDYHPIHVNIQGGQDSWSIEENEQFMEKALAVQAKYPEFTSSHEVRAFLRQRDDSISFRSDPSHSCSVQSIHYSTSDQTFSKSSNHR